MVTRYDVLSGIKVNLLNNNACFFPFVIKKKIKKTRKKCYQKQQNI